MLIWQRTTCKIQHFFSCFSPQIPFWSPEEIIYSIHPPSPEKSEELSVGSDTPSYVKRRGQLASLSQLHSLGDRRDSATPLSAPIRLSTGATSPNNFLRTPTLGGKWQWKSVEKGDASPSGYKIKCIFCNFREKSLKSWVSNSISKFYDFCMKTLFSPVNSKLRSCSLCMVDT